MTRNLNISASSPTACNGNVEHVENVDPLLPNLKKLESDDDSNAEEASDTIGTKKASSLPRQRQRSSMRTPTFCLTEGLNRKEPAWKADSWIALSLTLDGRDKITKVLQYSARFLAWWLAGNRQAERFQALRVSLTTSRKAFRLGRSLIEYHKIRSVGILRTLGWHLQQTLLESDGSEKPVLRHRVSSNIGWGPSTAVPEDQPSSASPSGRNFYRSLSSMAYRRMYRPMLSRMSCSFLGDDSTSSKHSKPPESPIWMIVGSVLKMFGLFGYWTADNVAFLTSSGFFDDLRADKAERLSKRTELQTRASLFANRTYFGGALAGLMVSLKSYWDFRGVLQRLQRKLVEEEESSDDDEVFSHRKETIMELQKAKEKEFTHFLALLKSCCDVLVFTNNPGIDLWEKARGKKMHEGLHCVAGLVSASTVIYNNFPNKKTPSTSS
jgi:hypothetical protein